MTAGLENRDERVSARAEIALPGVTETRWGYVVIAGGAVSRSAGAFERAAWIGGLALLSAVGALWLVLPLLGFFDLGVLVAPSGGLAVAGLALCWLAERGFLEEVQVDLEARSLRCTLSNARGGLRIRREVAFDEVGSVFVQRAERPGQPSKLFVRVGTGDDLIEVARGREAVLTVLQARMARDLQGSSLRKANPGRRMRRRRGLARPLTHAA
ncbi:hypothetical protein [Rhodovulum steppense]|uniref:Uncharacterized protein n=1 Tax=Rhodovulum steppense TaxID=540251 RepID=A0A4R1YZ91_9RHOB|nr:hypothetical protein [Rhodovulum steppense]TCM86602.1 hypothetical protein EV216_104159 [Rhodovulum steppense]